MNDLYLYVNIRENRKGNHEWTIQKHRQYCPHKTQNEDQQNKKTHNKVKEKDEKHGLHQKYTMIF
jgi:hypothetical protein